MKRFNKIKIYDVMYSQGYNPKWYKRGDIFQNIGMLSRPQQDCLINELGLEK
jgi:hypothetical protein